MSLPSAIALAVGLVVAAFALGGRYQVISVGDHAVIVDRFTGQGRSCMNVGACFELNSN